MFVSSAKIHCGYSELIWKNCSPTGRPIVYTRGISLNYKIRKRKLSEGTWHLSYQKRPFSFTQGSDVWSISTDCVTNIGLAEPCICFQQSNLGNDKYGSFEDRFTICLSNELSFFLMSAVNGHRGRATDVESWRNSIRRLTVSINFRQMSSKRRMFNATTLTLLVVSFLGGFNYFFFFNHAIAQHWLPCERSFFYCFFLLG